MESGVGRTGEVGEGMDGSGNCIVERPLFALRPSLFKWIRGECFGAE